MRPQWWPRARRRCSSPPRARSQPWRSPRSFSMRSFAAAATKGSATVRETSTHGRDSRSRQRATRVAPTCSPGPSHAIIGPSPCRGRRPTATARGTVLRLGSRTASGRARPWRRRSRSGLASGPRRSPARAPTGLRLARVEPVEHVARVPRRPVLVAVTELALVLTVRSFGLLQEHGELFSRHVDLHSRPPSWCPGVVKWVIVVYSGAKWILVLRQTDATRRIRAHSRRQESTHPPGQVPTGLRGWRRRFARARRLPCGLHPR